MIRQYLYAVLALFVSVIIIYSLGKSPQFSVDGIELEYISSPEDQATHDSIESAVERSRFDSLFALLKVDFGNAELHYMLNMDFAQDSFGTEIMHYYMLKIADEEQIQSAYFGLVMYFSFTDNFPNAYYYFNLIKDKNIPYLHSSIATLYKDDHQNDSAIYYFQKEIALGHNQAYAYRNLVGIYSALNDQQALYDLIEEPLARPYIADQLVRDYYILKGDFWNYFLALNLSMSFAGFLSALMILFLWMTYLYILNKENFIFYKVFVFFFLGLVFTLLVFPLSDFFRIFLHFELEGGLINDFFYCFIGIGAVEEFSKLLPFLIGLWLIKPIKNPADYITYGSITALGFATFENALYIGQDHFEIINIRAYTAAVVHMFCTSVIMYTFLLHKEKRDFVPLGLALPIGFVLASFAHGFYDFWVLSQIPFGVFITIIFYLFCVYTWVWMFNNAFNHHKTSNLQQWDTRPIRIMVLWLFVGLLIFQHAMLTYFYGNNIADYYFASGAIWSLFFIGFLISNITNFDIIPYYWVPIFNMSFTSKVQYNKLINKKIQLYPSKLTTKIYDQLPVKGKIIARTYIQHETDFMVVMLDRPISYRGTMSYFLLFKMRQRKATFSSEVPALVHLLTFKDLNALNSSKNRQIKDLLYIDKAAILLE